MKKKIVSILGVSGATSLLVIALSLSVHTSQASTSVKSINIKALELPAAGKCTGPKSNGSCQCSNGYSCSDSSGCNSTPAT